MKYVVDVNGSTFRVDIDADSVRIDDVPVDVTLAPVAGTPLALLTVDGVSHRVLAERSGTSPETRGQFSISISGYRYAAEALDERTRVIRALSASAGRLTGPAPLVAPMPGLVVRVNVAPGDAVQAGQGLVVMEAMKMENELRASSAGRVKAVLTRAGAAVEKGATLIELQ